jgi:hypothetical protein
MQYYSFPYPCCHILPLFSLHALFSPLITAAYMHKAFAKGTDVEHLTSTAFILTKLFFSSPNPTINSIVVSFLNSIRLLPSPSSPGALVAQVVAAEATRFVRALDVQETSCAFQLAVLSSVLEANLARESVEGSISFVLSFLASLLERHVCLSLSLFSYLC